MLLACLKLVYFSTNWRPIKRSPKCDIVEIFTVKPFRLTFDRQNIFLHFSPSENIIGRARQVLRFFSNALWPGQLISALRPHIPAQWPRLNRLGGATSFAEQSRRIPNSLPAQVRRKFFNQDEHRAARGQ